MGPGEGSQAAGQGPRRKVTAMRCPRCETNTLNERERHGVQIDVCEQCRGVSLDRGELEKLITRAQEEFEEYERYDRPQRRDDTPPRGGRHDEPRKRKKKRGSLDVFEIFD